MIASLRPKGQSLALEQTCKSETIPGTGDQFSASNWRRLFQKLKENGFQLLQLQYTDN